MHAPRASSRRRHILSIDDAPFDKYRDPEAWVVGVITAGPGLLEGVLTTRLRVDGEGATEALAGWIRKSRFYPSVRAVFLEGITIAGLSVVDLPGLHARTRLPVISVDRKLPRPGRLEKTLEKLGWEDRIPAVRAAAPFHPFEGIFFTCAGTTPEEARNLLAENRGRSRLPEGIRLAHLVGQALVLGESRGRA